MKTKWVSIIAACGLLTGFSILPLAAQSNIQPASTQDIVMGVPKSQLAPPFSGTIGEVVKLANSGVDEGVVLNFVKNSPVPFNPDADEIIKLHNAGISSQVISAMLQRGGELRQQAAQNQPSSSASYNTAQVVPVQQQPEVQPVYVQPVDSAPASTVVYFGSPVYTYPVVYYGLGGYCYTHYYYHYPYYYSCYPRWGYYGGYRSGISVGARFGGTHFSSGAHFGGGRTGGGFRHR